MKKVNYFSGMSVKPDDLMTTQSFLERRIDINMNVIGHHGVVVGAETQDGTVLNSPYVWWEQDKASLGVYGLMAYDTYGRFIFVEPKFDSLGIEIPTVSNLTPDENGKLVEAGGGTLNPNSTYIMVIRYAEFDDPDSLRPHHRSGILIPSRINESFELYLRDSVEHVIAGDVILGYVYTGDPHTAQGGETVVNIQSVDESYRDVFGLTTNLFRANMSKEENAEALGRDLTFEEHINMVGGGKVTRTNPHGVSAEDLGIDIAATGKHQKYLHSNGLKTNNIDSQVSALYPHPFFSSETSDEKVYIEALSEDEDEIVVVDGTTITPSNLGERYVLDLSQYNNPDNEGFYILAVNSESKSITFNGPFTSEDSQEFVAILQDKTYYPICSFHWGRPYYTYYTLVLERVVGSESEDPDDARKTLTNVPSTRVFFDSTTPSSTTILTADLVVRSVDPTTQTYVGSIIRLTENGDQYWVLSKEQNIADEDRYDIDPLSWKDRRVFNNIDFDDIRREDLAAIRDAAPFSNNTATLYYARCESDSQLAYFQVGGKSLMMTIDGSPFSYTFFGSSELDVEQLLSQLNSELASQIPSDVKPIAYINHAKHLTIVASQSIVVLSGSANPYLGLTTLTDDGEDIKTLIYKGEMPSVQEMYYDGAGNLTNVYYITEGNYLRSHTISYNGDFVSGIQETVEVF